MVQETKLGVEAALDTCIYLFSPAVKVLFELVVIVPTVVEAVADVISFEPSPN
jgi:hypothetical protein